MTDDLINGNKLPWTAAASEASTDAQQRLVFPEQRDNFIRALYSVVGVEVPEADAPNPSASAARPTGHSTGDAASAAPAPRGDTFPPNAVSVSSSSSPLAVGNKDRDPLAASNAHLPYPLMPPLPGPTHPGDGMIVGPNHPLFHHDFRPGNSSNPLHASPRWGGDGYLPRAAVPPGARFDPVTPFEGPHGPGPRPRGGPPQGNPDWDDLPPPRFGGNVRAHRIGSTDRHSLTSTTCSRD